MKVIALEKYQSKHHLFRIKHFSAKNCTERLYIGYLNECFFHMLKNMHLVLEKHVFL